MWIRARSPYHAVHIEELVGAVDVRGRFVARLWDFFTSFAIRIDWHRLRVVQNHALAFHEFLCADGE